MASDKWAGFTDEDIKKLKTNPMQPKEAVNKSMYLGPIKTGEIPKKFNETEYFSKNIDNSNFISDPHGKLQQFGGKWKIKGAETTFSASSESLENCTCENLNCENYVADLSDESNEVMTNSEEKCFDQRSLGSSTDIQDLENFEIRQKRIEAENAKRRVLINKAILDKKKRTEAEAVKLAQISGELNRLDSNLSSDVSILRNYIEKASLEFSEAEKRYLKAEKELIEAKYLLFDKMQKKEQLTEHLCAIIEQNENRKANKLVELMKQLEMESIIEEFEVPEMQPILSKYCIMNEEAYHCCQTIKPSTQKVPAIKSQKSEEDGQTEISRNLISDENSQDEENST